MPPRIGPKRPIRVFLTLHREAKTLTQEQVGNRIKPTVDKGTVSRWENAPPGRLSLGVIAAYAEALGIHPTELYRPPGETSLDAMAAKLSDEDRGRAIGYLESLTTRKAG
jgi:transcriptional regulator with XRE-family HTH domain